MCRDSLAEDRLTIHVEATTANPEWTSHFERCIQRGIVVKSGSASLVAFTPYERSVVDIFVVTQPVKTEAGDQWGIAAAVVADARSSSKPPHIIVVTAQPTRSGMAFICRAAVELFYEKIVSEVTDDESLNNPQPFDAFEVEFPGFQ